MIPVSDNPQRISLSHDDKFAFTSDQRSPRLAVINTGTNTVERWVALPASGYGTAATSDGRWLLVAMPSANKVAVVDLQTFTVARTIGVPASPQEVLVRPDGQMAFVSCDVTGKVAVIRLSDWAVASIHRCGQRRRWSCVGSGQRIAVPPVRSVAATFGGRQPSSCPATSCPAAATLLMPASASSESFSSAAFSSCAFSSSRERASLRPSTFAQAMSDP